MRQENRLKVFSNKYWDSKTWTFKIEHRILKIKKIKYAIVKDLWGFENLIGLQKNNALLQ